MLESLYFEYIWGWGGQDSIFLRLKGVFKACWFPLCFQRSYSILSVRFPMFMGALNSKREWVDKMLFIENCKAIEA